ncbi:aspartate-semialdehyde dehydrogenase [Ectopseudomonas mendocina]|uniref:Aspartate-semialdehyde dehydrogenase n=1 Tax=Ectopseudomonas mendocina TaxID=300 RepID=A0ABZ2RDN4_ECTME
MSKTFDIAVIGATGSVGETLVQLLEEREFPLANLHLLASAESAGQSVAFKGRNLRVKDVQTFDFSTVRIVFFAAGKSITRTYAAQASAAGCSVIDLSNALAPEQAPRVVPEVNPQCLDELSAPYVLASPTPASISLGCTLAALPESISIKQVTVTACMAVSSRGREGVSELARQTAELLNARPLQNHVFDRQMAFNVLAQAESVESDGHSATERQIAADLKGLLGLRELDVAITCIQVPVFFGDSLSVSLQTESDIDLQQVLAALEAAPALELVDADDYPTAVGDAVGQDAIYVGRVRSGFDKRSELNLWITSDNVRKGAALNAVQLAELLIKHYL